MFMLDFSFSDRQRAVREMARKFADPVERQYRHVEICRIREETSEIQKKITAEELL